MTSSTIDAQSFLVVAGQFHAGSEARSDPSPPGPRQRFLSQSLKRLPVGEAYKDLKEKFVAAAKALKVGNGVIASLDHDSPK
jgi:hypothetical protein